MESIRIQDRKSESQNVVAVICRNDIGEIFKVTAYWTGKSWHPIGQVKTTTLTEVTHWLEVFAVQVHSGNLLIPRDCGSRLEKGH